MRIVVDVSPLALPPTGIGVYVRGSLRGLAHAAVGRHEIVAFAPTGPRGRRAIPAALAGLPVDRRIVFLPLARAWRTAWSRIGWPAVERVVGRLDVFHFSDWMYPPQRRGVRSTMIHDLGPLHFPQWIDRTTRRLHRAKYGNTARTCDLVFVNCEYTGRDVADSLAVPPDRIRVAYPGVDGRFSPEGERAHLGRPYVLTVANFEPRKNLETLLAAHRLRGGEPVLAVAGLGSEALRGTSGVVALGYVGDDELPALYRGAEALVYPSRFEGFGIPIVEAMASGIPVVASAHPSMDEASGDAAVRVDPESPEAIAHGIDRALQERDELVRRGRDHARAFRWERTGRVMLDAFAEAS